LEITINIDWNPEKKKLIALITSSANFPQNKLIKAIPAKIKTVLIIHITLYLLLLH
jgi:hypothetical protein